LRSTGSPKKKGATRGPRREKIETTGCYAVRACVSIHIMAPTFVIAKITAGIATPSVTPWSSSPPTRAAGSRGAACFPPQELPIRPL
jgi:hypothetical protein